MRKLILALLTVLLGLFLVVVAAPQEASADGVGHKSRIYHRYDSAVPVIWICIARHSLKKCNPGKANKFDLRRGEYTSKKIDVDGYWCPAWHDCRTYIGPIYFPVENSSHGKKRFVAVQGPFTYRVRVM